MNIKNRFILLTKHYIMTMVWTPKFKVGDYLKWHNEAFYIIEITENYYKIRITRNGLYSGYRYGPIIDNGYTNYYNPAILLQLPNETIDI